ncbi:MAG: metal ABC transporter substrate-binding protein, partial [Dehalococcoidales bacterium]|nr:metal ABC transporter substrate-binding protein [Dehalococcoidales bacterium]
LANAKLFILHGYPGESWADDLITAADNPYLTVVKANINGNWMIPSVQSAAVDKVLSVLSQANPENLTFYQQNANEYKARITAKETEIKSKFAKAGVSTINVIASARQADFLQWAGFDVVASFNSPQELTPQRVQELVDSGKTSRVTLVVNNLQDGQDAGKAIAHEIGAANLNLSNFPGGFTNTATWEKAIDYNVTLLLNAIK